MKNDLTFRYTLHQAAFWTAFCCSYSFAATFLLAKGFSTASVGFVLFGASFLSFALQPLLASRADRSKRNLIPVFMTGLAHAAALLFALLRFVPLPRLCFCLLYVVAVAFLDMQIPLLNSIIVYFGSRGWRISYNVGRGIGTLSFAGASLLVGYALQYYDPDVMLLLAIAASLLFAFISLSYPAAAKGSVISGQQLRGESCSLPLFMRKYKWYMFSVLGVLFIALVHIMTETYMINLAQHLGGGSADVGIALCWATLIEAPVLLLFGRFHSRFGSYRLLVFAGFAYVAKMLMFVLATDVRHLYFIELMQGITYSFHSPVQMYYAQECTGLDDMVKGQSVITAAYSLGNALGNLFGGIMIEGLGLYPMLYSSIVIAAMGTAVFLVAVPRALRQGRRAGRSEI
jgi:PPP family 3-phenylpropionic acid transporter